MARLGLIASLVTPLVLMGAGAHADDSAEVQSLREQLRSTVLQLRQLQDQQAQAPAPAAPAAAPAAGSGDAAKLAAAQGRARRAAASAQTAQAALAKAQAQTAALTSAAQASAAELAKAKTTAEQAADTNRGLTAERDQLKLQLGQLTAVATACQTKNDTLVAFSESLLKAYNRVSMADQLKAGEPFLGLKRVQLENIAQDREDTIRGARCDIHPVTTAPGR